MFVVTFLALTVDATMKKFFIVIVAVIALKDVIIIIEKIYVRAVFFETIFTESTVEELVDLVNYIFQSNIYKIEDNKFYIDDAEDGNFNEFSEEEFFSFLKNDLDNFSIDSIIDYFGNVDIITLD